MNQTPPSRNAGIVSQITKMPLERTFNVSYYSPTEDRQYDGTFLVRRPTLMQQMQITAKKSQMLGGLYYDDSNPGAGVPEEMDTIAEMAAFLSVAVVDGPSWFNMELYDPGVLFAVFSEAVKIDPFRDLPIEQTVGDAGPRRSGEDGDHQRDGAGHPDRVAALVDEEISSSSHQPGMDEQPSR